MSAELSDFLPISERVKVFAQEKDLSKLVDDTWNALLVSNSPNPTLYQYGKYICRIESDDSGSMSVQILTEDDLRLEASRRVHFWAFQGKEVLAREVDALPPMHCIKGLMSTQNKPLPVLKRLVVTPVFDSEGNLETRPGYSDMSKTYYSPNHELADIRISKNPTEKEVAEAVGLITDDLFVDFPFVKDSDRAHAVALFLLIPARNFIVGPTPLYAIDATSQGTGKGLMTNGSLKTWVGRITKMTEASSQDEWRKRIFAKLRQCPAAVIIDNVKNKLHSSAFEAALTTDFFEDRVLGDSNVTSVPVNCAWVVTGNNLQFDAEMARRTVRIRLDSQLEQPWLRTDFKHKDLEDWTKRNHKRLVWAGLTIIQAWVAAGKPSGDKVLGSYENWSRVMGGILKVCKIEGFLENLQEFYLESDVESERVKAFITLWHGQYGLEEVKATDLFNQATEAGIDLGPGNDRSVKTRLGAFVASLRGKVFENWVVTKGSVITGSQKWRLMEKAPF